MVRKRKELLSSAPWRTGEAEEDDEASRMSREGKVSVTSNPGETATMNVPRSKRPDLDLAVDDFEEDEIDPELRYSFQRNSRVRQPAPRADLFLFPSPPYASSLFPVDWAMRSRCSTNYNFSRVEIVIEGNYPLDQLSSLGFKQLVMVLKLN